MTTQFGAMPEPISLDDQRSMALLLIAQHLIKKEHYRFVGPELSPLQLEACLPGYQPNSPVRLICWWTDDELFESGLHEDRSPLDEFLTTTGPEPMFLEELINLVHGKALRFPPRREVESIFREGFEPPDKKIDTLKSSSF